jgi:hypothetical protein
LSGPGPQILQRLLAPRTFTIIARKGDASTRRAEVWSGRSCRRRASGPVDVAVVISSTRGMARHVRRANAVARAVVVLGPDAESHAGDPCSDTLLLGPGGGVWTTAFRAGIDAPAPTTGARRDTRLPWLLVAQGPALAAQVLGVARRRGVGLLGALATGGLPGRG